MKALELFSGLQSVGSQFVNRGHELFSIDNNEKYKDFTSMIMSVLDVTPETILEKFGRPDIIWASPPCTAFSVASLGHHWTGGKGAYIPKTEFAVLSKKIVEHLLYLIKELKPKYWFIENPRGMLRKMPFMYGLPRYTITYCQYGDDRMKPTDIWTNHYDPQFKPMCKPNGDCHVSAPRGSRTGTQGLKNNKLRSVIPKDLCNHIVDLATDKDIFVIDSQIKLF